jgi:hypothetical protein
MEKGRFRIIWLLPLALVITIAILIYAYAMNGQPVVLIRLQSKFGFDFRDFQWAARYLLEGRNPWEWERFVTPPWSALLMRPFVHLRPREAIYIFFALNTCLIFAGSLLFCASFPLKENWKSAFFISIIVILFSHPVYFLLQRGNIDGAVFFLLALGIFFSTRKSTWHNELISGFAFALAVHLKIYPILILFVIIAARRWRLAFLTTFLTMALALVVANLWTAFFEKLLLRQAIFTIQENGSLANFLYPMIVLPGYLLKGAAVTNINTIILMSYVLYIVLLCILLYLSFRATHVLGAHGVAFLLVVYSPFMLLIPSLAYQYEYINLLCFIPLVHWLEELNILHSNYLYLLVIGLVLCNTHSSAIFMLTQNPLAYFIPSFGLIMVALVSLKLIGTLTVWRH